MKIVSQLDPDGYFVSATIAQESPLEAGVYLIPAGAVNTPPPTIIVGYTMRYYNGEWVAEQIPIIPEPDPEELPPLVPSVVSMAQARLALNQLNLLEPVEIAISTLPRAAQIEWEFRATVQRDSGLVQALATGLQLSEQMLDELFTLAATF